jgi:AcrR family transcriptional regulator
MTLALREIVLENYIEPGNNTMHRHRLLEGMAHAVAARGYADTTISDIVREAAVSRRTFYEHFASKSHCLIALYEAASLNALNVLRDAIDPTRDWEQQVENSIHAYFGCLAQNPTLVRTLFIEILGLGSEGLAARRRVNDEIVRFMLQVINDERTPRKRTPPLSRDMAMAIVGGINELVLQAIEQDRVNHLHELAAPAIQLVRVVTGTATND